MTEQSGLMFLDDPERFKKLLATEDQDARLHAFELLDDAVICEIMRYGIFNDERMIEPLRVFYKRQVLPTPEDWRFSIFRHITGLVDAKAISINALLPFIVEDTERRIVSTAVIDYVSLGDLTDGDPMSRVLDVIGMIEGDYPRNVGAAFGALLNLGDERVCRLLLPLRDTLGHAEVQEAIHCSTGFLYAATADFYLDWLEGLEGDDQDSTFAHVAAGLGQMKKKSTLDLVFTGQRTFPMWSASEEDKKASYKPIPLRNYLARIASRMHALERNEPPPRVMPHVVAAWGLKPVTPLSEAVELRDRSGVSPSSKTPSQQPPDIETSKAEWWNGTYRIHLLWGKLNPDGPTLYCLGTSHEASRHRTFFRMLHFLGGFTSLIPATEEEITAGTIFRDLVAIDNGLNARRGRGVFDAIPSFLIVDAGHPALMKVAWAALSDGTVGRADWGRELAYRRRFGDDFFGRAGAEIRADYEKKVAAAAERGEAPSDEVCFMRARFGHLPQFADATNPIWTSSPCTVELLNEWFEGVRKPNHALAALSTLKQMWEGSASLLPDAMKERGIPWGRVFEFILAGGFRLPESE